MAVPIGWLTRSQADVPPGDDWLGERERRTLAALRIEPRRRSWRLGRWTAKAAAAAWLGVRPARLEVVAAADGAPEAQLDGRPAPVALSLSHRAGRAIAVVADPASALGCDLEVVEPRSPGFVRDWLTTAEQALAEAGGEHERDRRVNLIWAAKEAASKVRREGLRLDLRAAAVELAGLDRALRSWAPLRIDWGGPRATAGWWRADASWVMAVAAEPDPAAPHAIDAIRTGRPSRSHFRYNALGATGPGPERQRGGVTWPPPRHTTSRPPLG